MPVLPLDVAPWVLRAAELAGFATWTLDLGSGVLTSSSRVRSHLDLGPHAPQPTLADWAAAVHPEDRRRLWAAWRELIEHGREYVLDYRLVLPGDRLKHMHSVACVGTGPDGRRLAYGITQDVTEARLAAARLERQRDRSRAVVTNLQEGFLLSTADVILEVNPALCAMTGYSEQELVGAQTPYPFWPTEEVEELLALRSRLVAEAGGKAGVELVRKNGTRFAASLTVSPLPGDDGLWMITVRDTTAERERERLLLARAETDPLTGLLNSRAFRDALRRATCTAAEDGDALSLALLDVDHFKSVNDRFGHAVGDEVLCALAGRLSRHVGATGVVARVGGEEFALLLPGLDADTAHALLERALDAVRAEPFPTVGRVTASAGVAQLLDGMDDDGLYRLADTLLYEAKARGRDQVR